ncbi:sugar phosphate nucleotidyltransferase [Thermodesulfobacterium hveragerdense]|uniref:sugar phosphate nucleotidyltransferase n=1 Tax=Thermodesulfobacterium hveragerdense TaxID=53424 RepID=UPI003CCBC428
MIIIKIIGFIEKRINKDKSLINGGIYLLKKGLFFNLNFPKEFSFEKDFVEKYFNSYPFYGFKSDAYFIDIGIPEDYEKAKNELKTLSF